MISSQKHSVSDEYLAGVFDGEGTFCTNSSPKSGGGYHFRASVTMTSAAPVTAFHSRFGGYSYIYQPKRPNARLAYEWHASGLLAVLVAETLGPFLLVKGKQALVMASLRNALEFDGRKNGMTAEISDERRAAGQQLATLNRNPEC